jgi:hypothetical protein
LELDLNKEGEPQVEQPKQELTEFQRFAMTADILKLEKWIRLIKIGKPGQKQVVSEMRELIEDMRHSISQVDDELDMDKEIRTSARRKPILAQNLACAAIAMGVGIK